VKSGYFANQLTAARFRILHKPVFEEDFMPDDQTLATILAICDLIKHNGSGVESAVEAYGRAMKDVMEYRRANGITEVGGVPRE
jgi:predicted HTH transcriptional regulator